MLNTKLMVIPQLPAGTQSIEDQYAQLEESTGETLAEVLEEIDALTLRLTADKERVTELVDGLNKDNIDIISDIESLSAKIARLTAEMRNSDDLEAQLAAEEAAKLFDDQDTDHETRDNEADADSEDRIAHWSRKILADKCRTLYKKIARFTHPDKCRHLPAADAEYRRKLFLEAKNALDSLDYEALDAIHIKLLNKSHESLNLIQRLLRARERREALRIEMQQLRSSEEWQLFILSMHYGKNVARDQYRMSLEQTRAGLTQLLSQLMSAKS